MAGRRKCKSVCGPTVTSTEEVLRLRHQPRFSAFCFRSRRTGVLLNVRLRSRILAPRPRLSLRGNKPAPLHREARALNRDARQQKTVGLSAEKSTNGGSYIAPRVELLDNALKHAFANGWKGNLVVSSTAEGHRHVLELADDGVGMDQGIEADGFGKRSLSNLVRAMGGSITCQPAHQSKLRPGTKWRVKIPI